VNPEDLAAIAAKLHQAIEDDRPGGALSALIDLRGDRGGELLAVLQERYRAALAERIRTAGGNATTHPWAICELPDGDLILECGACRLAATPTPMLYGQVPVCGDSECTLSHHAVYAVDGPDVYTAAGKAYCIFCKTEYATTVEVEEVAGR
jgi:hypothetical protein